MVRNEDVGIIIDKHFQWLMYILVFNLKRTIPDLIDVFVEKRMHLQGIPGLTRQPLLTYRTRLGEQKISLMGGI